MDKKLALNLYLKNIKCHSELVMFQKILDWHGFYLRGKRRHYEAFDFRALPWNSNRVSYLYNDSMSSGRSDIKNLYKVLEVA